MDISQSKPQAYWITGLSGVGKTTLANALAASLTALNIENKVLDGDELRKTLCADLGFSKQDRDTNIQRIAELAYSLQQQGVVVIVSVISPYLEVRQQAIKKLQATEIYLEAPLSVLQKRDSKGLYAKAIAGELLDFTGVSAPYEVPKNPAYFFRTDWLTVEECVNKILLS
ncbi:adenylyl-sulfate kinase [Entomomonas asaccharolytica]|uniref:Adenylyl-sulfate kinase n=1 Tax=Entomomonas asaccharolytica TaxID=2785331 RepID=A0A974RX98_9GAMM|nr:adenylyl-sulfate kinase [Entomomonas asaccharolytica]QQP85998.1 adenylyl-sulfate kinase [Entomomonas asaccharolytica]